MTSPPSQQTGDDDATTATSLAYEETAEFSEHFQSTASQGNAPRHLKEGWQDWFWRFLWRSQADRPAEASSVSTERWGSREEVQDYLDPNEE
jgi:hypothetical protein